MDSQANGHANGHGSDGPHGGAESVTPVSAADERAMDGDAFATVGEWLAARRRALNLTREDVETATRVREDYLAAIEDMDPRRMPAGPYAPGFVRTYAIHLELDPETVAARFREEMSPRRLRTPHATRERTPIKIVIPPRLLVVLLGAGALAALIALGSRPPSGVAEVGVPAVPEGLAEWVAADVQSRRSSAAPELVVGPDLALRARVPVWLDARSDNGEVLVSRTLSAGEIWVAPRIPGVLVSADNGAAVEILLDGMSQGRLGSAGLPVTDWRADSARPLTAPAPPPAAVAEALVDEAAGAALEADAGAAAAEAVAALPEEVDESERLLSDLAAEDSLVSPDLSAETITQEALPDLVIDSQGFIPTDPDEAAAAEGRAPDAEAAADVPPAQ